MAKGQGGLKWPIIQPKWQRRLKMSNKAQMVKKGQMAPNEAQCCTRENNVFSISNITFFANFDSGNLARVEQEELPASSGLSFSTWTRPDCHVTKFEKRSWSWFF